MNPVAVLQSVNALGAIIMILIGSAALKKQLRSYIG